MDLRSRKSGSVFLVVLVGGEIVCRDRLGVALGRTHRSIIDHSNDIRCAAIRCRSFPPLPRYHARCDSRLSNTFFPLRVASSDGGAMRYASSVRCCSSVDESPRRIATNIPSDERKRIPSSVTDDRNPFNDCSMSSWASVGSIVSCTVSNSGRSRVVAVMLRFHRVRRL